jgi:hypothetical protein
MKMIRVFNPNGRTGQRGPGSETLWQVLGLALTAWLGLMTTGCSSVSTSVGTAASTNSAPDASQLYFAPAMGVSPATYSIDHTASTPDPNGTFVRTTYGITSNAIGEAIGATITDSGGINLSNPAPSNGVLSLSTTYIDGSEPISSPLTGSWAVELPGQAALIQLNTPAMNGLQGSEIGAANYFTPAVPTQSCPSLTTAQSFQFVTIPSQYSAAATISAGTWNPALETAYGSVQIATSGSSVAFSSIKQSAFPGTGATVSNPAPASAAAFCSTTFYGQTIAYPGSVTVTNPGLTQSVSPSATIGIGPSGFLVEDNGATPTATVGKETDPTTGLSYENILGAGYGAIGLPQPSSDPTSSLVAAQFQGFLSVPGSSGFNLISSFGGYSNQQTSCATLLTDLSAYLSANSLPALTNPIYGGEFTNNDPSSNPIGNCDMAIDLGTQNANGLYTNTTVYVDSAFPGFPANVSGNIYPFSAVAVAGQIQNKYGIFLIGVDTKESPARAWGIYLIQSN